MKRRTAKEMHLLPWWLTESAIGPITQKSEDPLSETYSSSLPNTCLLIINMEPAVNSISYYMAYAIAQKDRNNGYMACLLV
ncbi:hypothetical protein FRX31_018252 [Thalictrum thalictroides]|uniref:Uncharacterized protein n=1 Tax=Thalictrum thalictroides TaxID=46969 RepID=A0A7J6W6K4_THATH|nr:hypothetical protein FRX31_018252 [Thalictrum thalictroides]